MSSVCECPWDAEYIGSCVMRDRTARKILEGTRSVCPNCKVVVYVGTPCVDYAGLDCDGGGWFHRFHRQCFELMEEFGEEFCDGGWHYPFDLHEAAEHAASRGDEPVWKSWLLKYEETWAWTPEPPDPSPPEFRVIGPGTVMEVKPFNEIEIDGPFSVRSEIKKGE